MIVTVRSSTMVPPASETPRRGLWNSNLDLMMPSVHAAMVSFYRPDGSNNFFDVEMMKESLSKVLVPFYPMAGRLRLDDGGRIEINCNGEGVLFVEASTESKLDDLGDFAPTPEFMQLVPCIEQTQDISSYPLVGVQVTYFKCGGVCVATGIHHYVADGFSGSHFFKSWSELTRGFEAVSSPPFIDRTLVRARNPPTPTFSHAEYLPPTPLKTTRPGEGSIQNPKTTTTSVSIFNLTKDQIASLKAKVRECDTTTHYSTTEIVAAHIWRCVSKARGLEPEQETKLYVPMNGRTRFEPPLPSGYLGNVIFSAAPMAKSGELTSEPIYYAASKIHDSLARMMSNEYLRSAIDLLQMIPNLPSFFSRVQAFTSPTVVVNSLIRLPVHESDFGWGKPIFMSPANLTLEGLVFLLPSPSSEGGLMVALGLEKDHMVEFGKLIHDI